MDESQPCLNLRFDDASRPRRGYRLCLACDGQGFLARGVFGERRFVKCPGCGGLGQFYLPEDYPRDVPAC